MIWKTGSSYKCKHALVYDSANPFPSIYQRLMKTHKKYAKCTKVFILTLYIIANYWEQPKSP